MVADIKQEILQWAEPIVRDCGLAIWGLDVVGGPTTTVRLFVDTPGGAALDGEAPASASIEQCEEISRRLSLALEVEDLFPGHWLLEVSSPGLERKFYSLDQLRPYVGDFMEVNLQTPVAADEKRKTWRGRLGAVGEQTFNIEPCSLSEDGEPLPEGLPPVELPWNSVRRVSRIHLFPVNKKPGKGAGKKKARSGQ